MDAWDWQTINVSTGEWWLVVIALLIAVVSAFAGYLYGYDRYRRYHERTVTNNDDM